MGIRGWGIGYSRPGGEWHAHSQKGVPSSRWNHHGTCSPPRNGGHWEKEQKTERPLPRLYAGTRRTK